MKNYKKLKKNIYVLILKFKFKIKYIVFLRTKSDSISENILNKNYISGNLDIVTIAFNNPKMVEYQINLVKKFLTDSHNHIIADNSNHTKYKTEISDICKSKGVLYVSIPEIKLKPSWSHAAAMHWVYVNVIYKRKPDFFGFMDHDIFPTCKTSIINNLWNGVFGRVIPPYGTIEISENQKYWSLWAGFYFMKFSLIENVRLNKINFFPIYLKNGLVLDTGGGLWNTVLSRLPLPDTILTYEQIKIKNNDKFLLQSDAYEQLGDWVHIVNLSNWYKATDMEYKIKYFENYLENLLK